LKWPLEWAILLGLCLLGIILWITSKSSRETTTDDERDHLILEKYK
jgi:hypothetical protein